MIGRVTPVLLVLCLGTTDAIAKDAPSPQKAEALVEKFTAAVEKLNKAHRAKPGDAVEADLPGRLPKAIRGTLDRLLAMPDDPPKWTLLAAYGEAAAELDMAADLARVEKALGKGAPQVAETFGRYISRPRFLLHALRVQSSYAAEFADVLEGVLKTYDKTFGFREFSKVAGKKIRVILHREAKPRPPQFAPQYPFHSTIDFPIASDKAFTSPTSDGKFLFYGLCHELGHLIAMWGDRRTQEDHHAWAHYTGVVIVDACAKAPFAKRLRDKRWRSVEVDKKNLANVQPSADDREGVLRLLLDLHDLVGPKKIGDALNRMDEKNRGHRINAVRYYGLADLQKALLAGKATKKQKRRIKSLFP